MRRKDSRAWILTAVKDHYASSSSPASSLRRPRKPLAFCYEAGPCGYGVYRQLISLGHRCDVVAPSLIPTKAGDRVKTNRRDATMLARLHRAGELTPVWVPDTDHEAMRDLIRLRSVVRQIATRARQHLQGFLLRPQANRRTDLRPPPRMDSAPSCRRLAGDAGDRLGLMIANHPLIVGSLNRRQSGTSLTKLLRDPLGYLWTYGFRWQEPDETEEPLQLDPLAIGGLLHATLEPAVSGLELAKPGGFGTTDDASILAAVGRALDAVAQEWERARPVPPPVIWERKLHDIRTLAVAA